MSVPASGVRLFGPSDRGRTLTDRYVAEGVVLNGSVVLTSTWLGVMMKFLRLKG